MIHLGSQTSVKFGERISYQSDGLKITGLLGKPEGPGPFPLILVNHGGFDPAEKVSGFVKLFVQHGFVALASDYRGCGGSEGTRGVAKGEVDDILNAIQYAKGLPFVNGKSLILWGFSHGATISLLAASRNAEIRAVVAVQGPVDFADCFEYWHRNENKPGIKPLLGLSLYVGGTPDQLPDAWKERSALCAAGKIKCPVLLIYSDRDDTIPPDQGPKMEKALKDAGNSDTRLILVKGANHGLDPKSWGDVAKPMLDFVKNRAW